jgi:hypothetical protein
LDLIVAQVQVQVAVHFDELIDCLVWFSFLCLCDIVN